VGITLHGCLGRDSDLSRLMYGCKTVWLGGLFVLGCFSFSRG
jgi:hypothetical protein